MRTGKFILQVVACMFACWLFTVPRLMMAQSESTSASASAPSYTEPVPVYYEFGLKIKSTSLSKGITASVPIPIEWPEQSIEIVDTQKTANLKKLTFKNTTKEIRQMFLRANQLGPGDVAEATVVIQADKRHIAAPEDPSTLVFAKKFPTRIKQYLRPSPYIESNNKQVKLLAKSIELDEDLSAWQQVEKIYDWVREKIEYKFDTQIHSCMHALENGHGDCEELSSVFIAICRCKGIPARAVWIPGHTYPEFYLSDPEGNGYWFPCQAAGSRQFGEMSEDRPILQKGDRFKLPGNRQYLRYVQPTLVAKESNGGLSIEYISRRITDPAKIEQFSSSSN